MLNNVGRNVKSNYSNLDILRSMAVMSVVAYHLWRACVQFHLCSENLELTQILHNASYTGVMFFFVHTSLVLMLSLHRSPQGQRGIKFLIRRGFRIYPLCWVTIIFVLVTGLTDHPENNLHSLGMRGVVANLLLVQNLFHKNTSIVGPLWSLPWEIQMYLVLPIIFAFLKQFRRTYAAVSLWLGATLLAIGATNPRVPLSLHLHAAVFPPMFIAGMVAYRLLDNRREGANRFGPPAWTWPFFVLCLFSLQATLVGYRNLESPFGAAVDAGICMLLALAIPLFPESNAGILVRPAHHIAKYSYGIYLLHVPTLMFVLRYLHALPFALKVLTFLVFTALIAVIAFHAIEDPLIRIGKRITQAAKYPEVAKGQPTENLPARGVVLATTANSEQA